MTKLDYEPKRPGAPRRVAMIFYLLLWAPAPVLALAGLGRLSHRGDRTTLVIFSVCLGLAIGAAIHILRRRLGDGAAWTALVIWGGLTLVALVGALSSN